MSGLPDSLPSVEELGLKPLGTETGGGRPGRDGKPRRSYSEDDKERALLCLIRCAGDVKRAAEVLQMRESTLQHWKTYSLADRYHELRVKYAPELEEHRIAEIQELVDLYASAEREVVSRFREEVPNLEPRELAKSAQALAVAKDKNLRDYLTLQGRPVQVTEQRSPDRALQELQELGVIEVESVEVPGGS